jgi:centlein
MVSQKSEIEYLQEKLKEANEKLSENRSTTMNFPEKSIMISSEGKHKVETFCHFVNSSG